LSQIPTLDLIEQLRYLGGTPSELLNDNQMMQFLLPVLRADFSVCEKYTYLQEPPLDCAISAFGGLHDRYVSHEDLAAWQTETHGTVMVELFPGGHFFIHQERELLLQSISKNLLQHCSLPKP
jgi:medium-chain acyl-[acyl-carrier-protein] hydrolase